MRRCIAYLIVGCLVISMLPSSFAVDLSVDQSVDQPGVYSISADTTLYDLAVNSGISPLSTSTPTYWSDSDIQSVKSYLSTISQAVGAQYSNNIYTVLQNLQRAIVKLNTFESALNVRLSNAAITATVDLSPITDMLGFPSGKSLFSSSYQISNYDGELEDVSLDRFLTEFYMSVNSASSNGFPILAPDGTILEGVKKMSMQQSLEWGLPGLAAILRGQSGSTITGKLISSTDLTETEFSANNLLSMLSPLLNIQNDLAQVTNVIADPLDQALNDANKENKQEIVDSFSGSGGAGVKKDDIGDMAAVSGDLTGNLNTGVTVGDAFTQIGDSSNYSFFSAECAAALDSVPVSVSEEDDDFVHFYDPENKALFDLLGRGGE